MITLHRLYLNCLRTIPFALTLLLVACDSEESSNMGGTAARPGGETTAGESVAGESVAGESVAGESVAGESVAGESVAGESGAGESVAGESGAGESVAGESGAGESGAGESGAGESGAGESGAGEQPPLPERPELPRGREDSLSQLGCDLIVGEVTPVVTVSDRADAGQVTVLPSNVVAYDVALPESGTGYFTLEVPDWAITVSILTHYANSVTVFDNTGAIEVVGPLGWSASCADLTEERLHFHSWGSYVVEVRGAPLSSITLSLTKRD